MSQLHVFRLDTTDDFFTASTDRSGRNLPRGEHIDGDWKFIRTIPQEDLPKLVSNAKEAPTALAQGGYFHLEKKYWLPQTEVKVYFKETEMKNLP